MTFTVTVNEEFIQSKLNEYANRIINEIMSDWDFKGDLTRQVKSAMKAQIAPMIEQEFSEVEELRSEIRDRISRALTAQITKKIKEEVDGNE